MMQKELSDFVTEPARKRPVLYDVDVAVAGSGLCSTFAAIAALDCVTAKNIEIRKVQKRLVSEGIYLGNEERLRELGLE